MLNGGERLRQGDLHGHWNGRERAPRERDTPAPCTSPMLGSGPNVEHLVGDSMARVASADRVAATTAWSTAATRVDVSVLSRTVARLKQAGPAAGGGLDAGRQLLRVVLRVRHVHQQLLRVREQLLHHGVASRQALHLRVANA